MNNDAKPIIQPVNEPVHIIKRPHSLWYFLTGMLIGILLIGGFFYWYTLQDKPINETMVDTPTATSTSETISEITLNNIPITFQLPEGYIAIQEEGFEGGYGSRVMIGKHKSGQSYQDTPLQISFSMLSYDSRQNTSMNPEEYVDVLYKQIQQSNLPAEYIHLLGNKAVKFKGGEVDDSTTIVGYIKDGQSQAASPYWDQLEVRITSGTYGSAMQPDPLLFNTVVNSLKIK